MHRLPLQWSVTGLLLLVAGVALNVWLFRFGTLLGLLGLSVTKHLVIAWLCQVVGVDRHDREVGPGEPKAERLRDAGPARLHPLAETGGRRRKRGPSPRSIRTDSGVGADRPPR